MLTTLEQSFRDELLRVGHVDVEKATRWILSHRGLVTQRTLSRLQSLGTLPNETAARLLRDLLNLKVASDRGFAYVAARIGSGFITMKVQLRAAERFLRQIPEDAPIDDAQFAAQCRAAILSDEELSQLIATALPEHERVLFQSVPTEKLVWLLRRADERLRFVSGPDLIAAIQRHQRHHATPAAAAAATSSSDASAPANPQQASAMIRMLTAFKNTTSHRDATAEALNHGLRESPSPDALAAAASSRRALSVDLLREHEHRGKTLWVAGALGRVKEPLESTRTRAELFGLVSSCVVEFISPIPHRASLEHHHVAMYGSVEWDPIRRRPILLAERWVVRNSAIPHIALDNHRKQCPDPPPDVWTWDAFNQSSFAPPEFLRGQSSSFVPLNRHAVLIVNTGGTFSCVQNTKDGLLSPQPLYEHMKTLPGFAGQIVRESERQSLPNALYVLLEDEKLMLDSTCMNAASSWNLLCMILESRTAPSAMYRAIVVIHGTDTLAYSSCAATFALRGLRIPIVFTGSQMPLRAVLRRPLDPSNVPSEDSEADDTAVVVPGSGPLNTTQGLSATMSPTERWDVTAGDVLSSAQFASQGRFTPRQKSALGTKSPGLSSRQLEPLGPGVTDALENLTRALVYAQSPKAVNEVVVFFNNKVMLGTRVVKAHAVHFDAFVSPNFSILAFFDGQLRMSRQVSELIARASAMERALLESTPQSPPPPCFFHWNARALLFEINPCTVPDDAAFNLRALIAARDGFDPAMEVPIGIVFRGYGAGNAQPEVCNLLRFARKELCIPVIWCSQCFAGSSHTAYSVGLGRVHGVNVSDMTRECAYVRMLHAISQFAGVYGRSFRRSKRFVEIVEGCLEQPYRLCFSPNEDDNGELADYIRDSTIARYQ